MIVFYILVMGMPLVHQPLFASYISDLTMAKYMGGACVLYAVAHLGLRRRLPAAFASRIGLLFLALYLVALVSHLTRSLPAPWEMSPILTLTSFLLLYFVVTTLVDTPLRLRRTLLVAMASIVIGSLYMIREWLEYHNVYKHFRPGFVVGDSNYFTLSALLCLPVAFYLLFSKPTWWERVFLAGGIGVTLIAVMLGASRGGFLGLIAEGVFILWHGRHRVRGIVLAAAVLLPLFVLAPSSPLHRLRDPNYSDRKAEMERLVTWGAGLSMFRRYPLTGIGLGNFKPMVLHYEGPGLKVHTLAHNTYIELAAELGLPGLLLFGAAYFTAYRRAGWAAHLPTEYWICRAALGIQAGLIGCGVGIVFLSALNQKLMWLMIFLSPCVVKIAEAAVPALSVNGADRNDETKDAGDKREICPQPVPRLAPKPAHVPLAEMLR